MSNAQYQPQDDDLMAFEVIETSNGSRAAAAAFGPSTTRREGGDGSAGVAVNSTTGKAEAQFNGYSATAEGPHVRSEVFARSTEMGAMAEIGTGKAEANAGILNTTVGLNANTGARVGTKGAEVNVLGFGMAIGKKTSINTPLGSIGFKF